MPENEQLQPGNQKNSRHVTVVKPPCYDTNRPLVALLTPALHFTHIPAGQAASRAVVVRAASCAPVHLEVVAGPTVLTGPAGTAFTVSTTLPVNFGGAADEGRVWITSHGTAAGDVATGTVTVRCTETAEDFVIPISMDTVVRQTLAAALVLDRSGSMSLPSGLPGRQRIDVLHTAAPAFVDLLRDDDAVGVVQFDHESNILAPVVAAGDVGDPAAGRNVAKDQIAGLAPRGATSIGAGLQQASAALAAAPPATGARRATVVFTDGYENTRPFIADVAAATISDRVYAIGLGTPDQLDPAALKRLCDNRDGFLMLTGILGANDAFRLTKYFLQILAGATNAEIVTDPQSAILPGQTPHPVYAQRRGVLGGRDPSIARRALPRLRTRDARRRPHRPVDPAPNRRADHPRGHRLLPLHAPRGGRCRGSHRHMARRHQHRRQALQAVPEHPRRHRPGGPADRERARSSLQRQRARAQRVGLDARLLQDTNEPGARFTLRATLTEAEVPFAGTASVNVELEAPDGSTSVVALTQTAPDVFQASANAPLPGIYPARFSAGGTTGNGMAFTRDVLRTGAVWRGGDEPLPSDKTDPHGRDKDLCRLISCLEKNDGIRSLLEERGIDPKKTFRCFEKFCEDRTRPGRELGA